MNKTFIYLVPSKRSSYYKTRNEYFIIDELRKLGHQVHVISSFYYLQIRRLKKTGTVDGLIFNSLKLIYPRHNILKWARHNKLPVYWWYFDTATLSEKRQHRVIETAKLVDVFFNKDKPQFEQYRQAGINPIWLDQGVPPACESQSRNAPKFELGFFGSSHAIHGNRLTLLKKLDQQYSLVIYTPDISKFNSAGFNNVRPAVSQSSIGKAVSEIKIVLVLNSAKNTAYCWSDRIHLMIGSGAFTLVEYLAGLDETYTDEQHCIYFSNNTELVEKIEFYLNDDKLDIRSTVANNGYHWANTNHSYTNRTMEFLEAIL